MRAADAGFEHASTPHRQVMALAEIVNLLGLAKSSHAADFDIDDPTSSGFDGSGTIAGVTNGFIEADRSEQFTLKPRVVIDVIVPERLFVLFCFCVPEGVLDGGFGHAMTTHFGHQGHAFAS